MEDFYSYFISMTENILKDFSRELIGVKSIYLLDNDGFTIFSLYGNEREERILHHLISLLKKEFSFLNLLEIENSSSRLCLTKISVAGYYIAVFTSSNVTPGLVRVKLRKISSKIAELLSNLEKAMPDEEEEVSIDDLMKFLDFLSTRR